MNELEELKDGVSNEDLIKILSRGILQRENIIEKLTQINYILADVEKRRAMGKFNEK